MQVLEKKLLMLDNNYLLCYNENTEDVMSKDSKKIAVLIPCYNESKAGCKSNKRL